MDRHSLQAVLFRHRSGLPLALATPVAIAALRGGGVDAKALFAGVFLVVAGAGLRLLALRRIGRGARVHRAGVRGCLVVSGPYRWSRNPLYLAAGLILSGLGVVAGAGWGAAWLLPALAVAYSPVVRAEEAALEEQLGAAYRRYKAATPRWIGLPRARCSGRVELTSWRAVLRREKALLPGCLAACLGVAAVRSEWVPLAPAFQGLTAHEGGADAALVIAAVAVALLANTLHIERHWRRRVARRLGAPMSAGPAR